MITRFISQTNYVILNILFIKKTKKDKNNIIDNNKK